MNVAIEAGKACHLCEVTGEPESLACQQSGSEATESGVQSSNEKTV